MAALPISAGTSTVARSPIPFDERLGQLRRETNIRAPFRVPDELPQFLVSEPAAFRQTCPIPLIACYGTCDARLGKPLGPLYPPEPTRSQGPTAQRLRDQDFGRDYQASNIDSTYLRATPW